MTAMMTDRGTTVDRLVRLLCDARRGAALSPKAKWLLVCLAVREDSGHAGPMMVRELTARTGLSPEELRNARRQAEAEGLLAIATNPERKAAEWRLTLPDVVDGD